MSSTTGTLVLSDTRTYPSGTYTITVEVIVPEGCPSHSITMEVECEPKGSCCLPDGSCEELTAAECRERAGMYQGDGTSCGDEPCNEEPTGACCLPDGTCAELTEAECREKGGDYRGDNVNCADVDCENPTILCCLPDDSCITVSSVEECERRGGSVVADCDDCGGSSSLCGSFVFIIAGLLSLAAGLGVLVLAMIVCLGISPSGILLGILIGVGAAAAVAIAISYVLCGLGICPCLTACDWMAISWVSLLTASLTAFYLSTCCIAMFIYRNRPSYFCNCPLFCMASQMQTLIMPGDRLSYHCIRVLGWNRHNCVSFRASHCDMCL